MPCPHLPFSWARSGIAPDELPPPKGYTQEQLMILLSVSRASFKVLLDRITERRAGGVCAASAPCRMRYFVADEDRAKAARCETLCGVAFPADLVRILRARNADEGRLGFLLYHCLLAADKRVQRKETYKVNKARKGKEQAAYEEEEEDEDEAKMVVVNKELMAKMAKNDKEMVELKELFRLMMADQKEVVAQLAEMGEKVTEKMEEMAEKIEENREEMGVMVEEIGERVEENREELGVIVGEMGEKVEVMEEVLAGVDQLVADKVATAVGSQLEELKAQGVNNFEQLMAAMMSLKK